MKTLFLILLLSATFIGCTYTEVKQNYVTKVRPAAKAVIETAKFADSIAITVDSTVKESNE